ncbi:MAG: hypothetical protein RLY87_2540 [Chloroflexota bacterium]
MNTAPSTQRIDAVKHLLRELITPNETIRVLVVAFLWLLTFWCIQMLQGHVSTAFVVYGRVLATSIAGLIVLRKNRTPWNFLPEITHFLVAGSIHALLPLTLFLSIRTLVPQSSNVVMPTVLLLSFALAIALLRGQPLQLRVLILGNLGVIAAAWILSKTAVAALWLCLALSFVVCVNTIVVWLARWYTRTFLPDTPSLVATTAAQCVALGWLIPLVSWYGTRIPSTFHTTILVLCIWLGAAIIAFWYQHLDVRAGARAVAAFAPSIPLVFAYPWTQSNGRLVDTIVMLMLWGITLILLRSESRQPAPHDTLADESSHGVR